MRAAFPWQILHQQTEPQLVGQTLAPRLSVSGAETVVATPSARWRVTCGLAIRDEAQHLAWRAFRAQMQGRLGTALVPILTRFTARDRDGLPVGHRRVAGLADSQTAEHWGFAAAPVVTLSLAAAAPLRATVLSVIKGNTTGLRPGHYFSLGERLHLVQHAWREGGVDRVMIDPPLRAAAPAGAVLVADRPVCLMRFAGETEGSFDEHLDRLPVMTCTFEEAL